MQIPTLRLKTFSLFPPHRRTNENFSCSVLQRCLTSLSLPSYSNLTNFRVYFISGNLVNGAINLQTLRDISFHLHTVWRSVSATSCHCRLLILHLNRLCLLHAYISSRNFSDKTVIGLNNSKVSRCRCVPWTDKAADFAPSLDVAWIEQFAFLCSLFPTYIFLSSEGRVCVGMVMGECTRARQTCIVILFMTWRLGWRDLFVCVFHRSSNYGYITGWMDCYEENALSLSH